jgi:hypothetical protein
MGDAATATMATVRMKASVEILCSDLCMKEALVA